MNRVNQILGHVGAVEQSSPLQQQPTAGTIGGPVGTKGDNDVVIVSALRTAIGRARKGGFRNTTPDTLLAAVLEATVKKTGVKYEDVGDINVGNVQLDGAYAGPARMAMFQAGYPETVPISAVNRMCSSGLQACANIANSIAAGQIDAGIGAGVESMTYGGGVSKGAKAGPPPVNFAGIMGSKLAKDSMITMGMTSENVAERYGITRKQQDEFAILSNQKALNAIEKGYFKDEIIPVATFIQDKEKGKVALTVDTDEGPRNSTMESLGKLRTAFKKEGGTTTAGNASQTSDGAAAVLMMRRSKAVELGMEIQATFRGFQVVGCPPDVMGIGPAVAIPAVLKATGLTMDKIDLFEINEAFASQAVYCVQELKIPIEKVNPKGGAIALGHPMGATGARQIATLLPELKRTGGKLGVVSMCIGTGMGAAAVIEME